MAKTLDIGSRRRKIVVSWVERLREAKANIAADPIVDPWRLPLERLRGKDKRRRYREDQYASHIRRFGSSAAPPGGRLVQAFGEADAGATMDAHQS
jgi:hypothetical protein